MYDYWEFVGLCSEDCESHGMREIHWLTDMIYQRSRSTTCLVVGCLYFTFLSKKRFSLLMRVVGMPIRLTGLLNLLFLQPQLRRKEAPLLKPARPCLELPAPPLSPIS